MNKKTSLSPDCPVFKACLKELCPNKKDREELCAVIGAALISSGAFEAHPESANERSPLFQRGARS